MNLKKYIAELIWTFALIFFGTGAVIVNMQTGGDLWLLGISLVFGIIVTSMIYIFANISGTHINPAVTIALAVSKKIGTKDATFYVWTQLIWALLASVILKVLFPENIGLWQTLPSGSSLQSFFIEIIMTFFLMMTILWVTSQWNKYSQAFAGIVIGWFIVAAILLSGPISGGSFNPARSLAPALVSWNLSHIWIYILWPLVWSTSAIFIWDFVKK